MMHIRSKKRIRFIFIILILFFPLVITSILSNEKTIIDNNTYDTLSLSSGISNVDTSFIPEINYTALNSTWYQPKIEMLIIVQDTIDKQNYIDAITPLMNWKNKKGLKTIILDNYTSYSGNSDEERLRNMIISFYNKEDIKWVLLAGDVPDPPLTTYGIPIKNINNPSLGDEPTDFYYADLDSDWSDIENLDWTAEVYVGRLPASTSSQLEAMVNKTLKYETDPYIGDWMNRMLLTSGISDLPNYNQQSQYYDPDGEDEGRLTTYIIQNIIKNKMDYTHLCDYNGRYESGKYIPPQPFEDLTSSNTDSKFNLGYSTAIIAGHGNSIEFSSIKVNPFYTETEASTSSNTNMATLIYGDACSVAPFDDGDTNLGETLIKKASAGAIGFIGSLEDTYYYTNDWDLEMLNRANAKLFWMEFFENNKHQPGKALYDSKLAYVNSDFYQNVVLDPEYPNPFADRRNLLTYNLLGDPEVDIYTDIPASVPNPFTGNIYEGQLISINLNPYSKVHLRNELGAYRTIYADESGVAKFRLPLGANINYNVTITGHNYIPSYINFTTLADEEVPFPSVDCTPEIPTTFKNVQYDVCTNESGSGVECIYSFLSVNRYDSYDTHFILNNYLENDSIVEIILNRLDPGQYNYSIYIFARDYANNTQTYTTSILISISAPLTDYILTIALILMIGVAGISIIVVYSGNKKYSLIYKRTEEL